MVHLPVRPAQPLLTPRLIRRGAWLCPCSTWGLVFSRLLRGKAHLAPIWTLARTMAVQALVLLPRWSYLAASARWGVGSGRLGAGGWQGDPSGPGPAAGVSVGFAAQYLF